MRTDPPPARDDPFPLFNSPRSSILLRMSKSYNVGVIGYGWAATAHIEAINNTSRGQVTAVYSSRALDPAELSAAHGGDIKVYQRLEDLLADDSIDVVDITSYPAQHKDQAIAAAEAGKAVILEKPVTLNLEDAEAIREAFRKNGTRSCVCLELRFISQFTTIKALLDEGMIGDIHYGEIDYYHGIGPWYGQYRWNTTRENGGSSLLSAGCHALDALLLCMDGEVEEVTAYETTSKNAIFQKYEYATATVSLLKFADGRGGGGQGGDEGQSSGGGGGGWGGGGGGWIKNEKPHSSGGGGSYSVCSDPTKTSTTSPADGSVQIQLSSSSNPSGCAI